MVVKRPPSKVEAPQPGEELLYGSQDGARRSRRSLVRRELEQGKNRGGSRQPVLHQPPPENIPEESIEQNKLVLASSE